MPRCGSRSAVRSSLPNALEQAKTLTQSEASAVTTAAQHAFVEGVHFAVTAGATLAAVASIVVFHYLPHVATHESAVESVEHMAELRVGGTPPVFATEAATGSTDR